MVPLDSVRPSSPCAMRRGIASTQQSLLATGVMGAERCKRESLSVRETVRMTPTVRQNVRRLPKQGLNFR